MFTAQPACFIIPSARIPRRPSLLPTLIFFSNSKNFEKLFSFLLSSESESEHGDLLLSSSSSSQKVMHFVSNGDPESEAGHLNTELQKISDRKPPTPLQRCARCRTSTPSPPHTSLHTSTEPPQPSERELFTTSPPLSGTGTSAMGLPDLLKKWSRWRSSLSDSNFVFDDCVIEDNPQSDVGRMPLQFVEHHPVAISRGLQSKTTLTFLFFVMKSKAPRTGHFCCSEQYSMFIPSDLLLGRSSEQNNALRQ